MFPLQRSGELSFEVASKSSSNSDQHQRLYKISQDLVFSDHNDRDHQEPPLLDISSSVAALASINVERNRRRRKNAESMAGGDGDEESTRKKKHREIEKQRRQEMAGLYADLRSLLPLEYIKGKRSISDHMNEAVNYIKHLHAKINELRDQQDKVKRLSDSSAMDSSSANSTNCCQNSVIEIVHLADTNDVEIIISRGLKNKDENFPLSTVLELLLQRGLNVMNCFSTRINDRTLNKIQCEATDAKSMDLNDLQQKLDAVIN